MGDEATSPLMIPSEKTRPLRRTSSYAMDELQVFRSWLKWLCVDQSNAWTACLSWLVFIALALVVPAISHFVLACTDNCDDLHTRPYDAVAQLSLSSVAALSFLSLSTFVSSYGLRRFLFFDKLSDESETVRRGYTNQLNVLQISSSISSSD